MTQIPNFTWAWWPLPPSLPSIIPWHPSQPLSEQCSYSTLPTGPILIYLSLCGSNPFSFGLAPNLFGPTVVNFASHLFNHSIMLIFPIVSQIRYLSIPCRPSSIFRWRHGCMTSATNGKILTNFISQNEQLWVSGLEPWFLDVWEAEGAIGFSSMTSFPPSSFWHSS